MVTGLLGWAITFLVIALVAALFGFGGVAGTSVDIAVILFWIFVILFVITVVVRLIRGEW